MKIRKLFPALTEANQTIDCPEFCLPACPYNCYPYPDYYYQPPPPPAPPTPPLSGGHNHYISPYVIVLVSVLAICILLVGYYVIIVKSCFGWYCSNRQRRQPQTGVSDEDFLDENPADNPIWFITTVGLQQSIINTITVCKYKKGEGLIEGTECSVCLNEFQEDETVRLLPKCNHAFHISCIDTWLRAHTNCPLCRAHIVFDAVSAASPTSADRNSDNMNMVVDNQIENREQNQGTQSELRENRARADDAASELPEPNDRRILKDGDNENGGLVIGDCIDSNQVVTKETQQIERCVSMDSSSSAATLFYVLANFEGTSFDQQKDVENRNSSMNQKQEKGAKSSQSRLMGNTNSSIVQHLHLSPVPMKRSISCSGRFFSSKHCRSMNSILPL